VKAIGKLIEDHVGTSPFRRWSLAYRLAQGNVNEGLRRLDILIKTGIAPAEMLGRLAAALSVDACVVAAALDETSEELWRERVRARSTDQEHARKRFRPHVYVETERYTPVHGQLCLVAVDGLRRSKQLPVDEAVVRAPENWQHRHVGKVVRQHYLEQGGHCGPFGRIVGYSYFPSFGQSVSFSVDGRLADTEERLSAASL